MGNDNWQNRSGMKRQHGRNNRDNRDNRDRRMGGGSGGTPTNRNQVLDSNGPMGRIRGNAFQICERYLSQARDAASSGDRIMAENLYQHAEHYLRLNNMFNEQREDFSRRQQRPEGQPDEGQQPRADVPEGQPPAEVLTSATQEPQQPLPGMEEQPSILDIPASPPAPDLFQAQPQEVPEGAPQQAGAPARPRRGGHWRRKPRSEGAEGAPAEGAPAAETPAGDEPPVAGD